MILFHIKTYNAEQDDYAMIKEVLTRRFKRAILEKEKSLVNLHKKVLKSVTELESKVEGLETGGDILVKCVEAGKELETKVMNLEIDINNINDNL